MEFILRRIRGNRRLISAITDSWDRRIRTILLSVQGVNNTRLSSQ